MTPTTDKYLSPRSSLIGLFATNEGDEAMLDELADAIEAQAVAAERERLLHLARLIVSYADLTHDVVVQGRDWREIAAEWRAVVEEARALLAVPDKGDQP